MKPGENKAGQMSVKDKKTVHIVSSLTDFQLKLHSMWAEKKICPLSIEVTFNTDQISKLVSPHNNTYPNPRPWHVTIPATRRKSVWLTGKTLLVFDLWPLNWTWNAPWCNLSHFWYIADPKLNSSTFCFLVSTESVNQCCLYNTLARKSPYFKNLPPLSQFACYTFHLVSSHKLSKNRNIGQRYFKSY